MPGSASQPECICPGDLKLHLQLFKSDILAKKSEFFCSPKMHQYKRALLPSPGYFLHSSFVHLFLLHCQQFFCGGRSSFCSFKLHQYKPSCPWLLFTETFSSSPSWQKQPIVLVSGQQKVSGQDLCSQTVIHRWTVAVFASVFPNYNTPESKASEAKSASGSICQHLCPPVRSLLPKALAWKEYHTRLDSKSYQTT